MQTPLIRIGLFLIFSVAVSAASAQSIQVVSEEFPPFNYTKNGEFTGVSTKVVKAVFEELGIDPEIKVYPWARTYKIALKDKNTLVFSIGRNEKREDLFHWIGVIVPSNLYLFSLHDRNDISIATLEDAKAYKIGTVREDVREQYLLSKGFTKGRNIYSNDTYEANLNLLLKERIDLWAMPELTAYYILEQSGLDRRTTIKKAFFLEEISSDGYYMALSKETPVETVNQFKKALKKIKQDGTYQAIIDEHVN